MTQTTTQKELRILLLEDSQDDAELNERELHKAGIRFTAKRVDSRETFTHALKSFQPDLILSDFNLPGFSGIAALGIARHDCPEIPVIFVTGALSDAEAANLMNAGAKDYVLKDRLARLAPAVQRALSVEQGVKIRKLTEAQLHEKTELLENVINSSHDYIFAKDRELHTILCNDVFARALGKKPEELYGKTDIENGWDAELVKGDPEKGVRGFEQDDLEALAGNVVHSSTDLGNIRGEIRYFDSLKVPLKSSNGEIFGMLGISRDVTERKQAEEMLRFHSNILQNLAEGVLLTRASDGVIVFTNPQFERMFGYEPGGLLGKHVSIVNAPGEKSPEVVATTIINELERAGMWNGEVQNIRQDGTAFWCHANVVAFDHPQFGKVWVAVHEDITERKQAEEALKRYAHDMNERVKEMSCLNDVITMSLIKELSVGQLLDKCARRMPDAWLDPSRTCARIRLGNREFDTPDFRETEWRLAAAIPLAANESGVVEVYYKGDENETIKNPFADEKHALINSIAMQIGLSLERRRSEQNLRSSATSLNEAQRIAHVGSWGWDVASGVNHWSDEQCRIFGHEPGTISPSYDLFFQALHPEDRTKVREALDAALEGRAPYSIECRILLPDGTLKHIHCLGEVERDAAGKPVRMAGTVRDITERVKSEERLRLTAKVFENTMEGITVTDKDNHIIEVNDAFTRITGYLREEVLGKTLGILKSGLHDKDFYAVMWQAINTTGHWRGDIWNRRKDGEVYPETLTISTIADDMGNVTNYVGIFSDITLLKQHEKQLEHIAHYDALTGIPNRVLLADRLQQAIAFSKREKKLLAICYLDLDGFKAINDSMGHEAGDLVLVEISMRIKNAVREGDTVARLGGDEFVILLTGLDAPEECAASLNRLLEASAKPIFINDKLFKLSASIGVSLYPLDDEDPDILLRHADQAMYSAKQSGRNRYYLYDTERDQSTRTRHEFAKRIRQGLVKGEFELFFQPKVDLRSGQPVGAEALIRWRHPERGLLSPAEFLPAIEDTALDIEVGEWVISTALDQLREWQQAGLDLELSINISAFHMQSPEFSEKLKQKLSHYPNLPHGKLQIEILETAALKDIAAATRIIESCRNFGVGFALDDFGTGYSSLSYLSNLPVDTLKIDQSFIRDMLEDKGDFAIVQGIIALSTAFNLKTVAEGVATDKCFSALLDMGCEIGQGYAIAHPMPAEEFSAWHKEKCSS
ncbi:MAG: EAL domain-containing protein [Gallionella sp.]|nr:EAL domain-containing protein [Gallionella sp.]